MSSRDFNIITKQSIDVKLVPDNVELTQHDGFTVLRIDDIDNFRYVLYLCINNESIEDARQMSLEGEEDDDIYIGGDCWYKSDDVSSLFNLIDTLHLTDFLIITDSDFAGVPDDEEFTVPVINGKLVRNAISCYLDEYDVSSSVPYKLLDIPTHWS
ncbi:MAG: hypothetical protein EOO42_01780 [Flavobacteriales bacterium]|nr:MAG: hypothetical protein EOO42_01780 [Flavobacteriales bacterium]